MNTKDSILPPRSLTQEFRSNGNFDDSALYLFSMRTSHVTDFIYLFIFSHTHAICCLSKCQNDNYFQSVSKMRPSGSCLQSSMKFQLGHCRIDYVGTKNGCYEGVIDDNDTNFFHNRLCTEFRSVFAS